MSETNNFFERHWEAFMGTLAITVSAVWVWWKNKSKAGAETSKIIVDRDIAKLNLKISTDKYIEEIEAKFQAKIVSLIEKVEASSARCIQLEKELQHEKVLRREVMAELTLYKTIKSTRR